MKLLFKFACAATALMAVVACNHQTNAVAPIEIPNLDSLKTYVSKAHQTKDPKGQFYAACYYLEQYNKADSTKAIDLLLKSASQNFPHAANYLGNIYSNDSTDAYYDLQKAIEFYEIGVKYGSEAAMTSLAALYAAGGGVKRDYQKAIQLQTDAFLGLFALAEKVDAMAQCGRFIFIEWLWSFENRT